MRNIVIYNINTSPGVRVIIDNLVKAFTSKGICIEERANCDDPDALYIPYGIKASYDCLKNKRTVIMDLMVDYLSYGCKNRAISLLRNGYVLSKEFWMEIACFILYRYKEKKVLKGIDSHMLVSYNDILKMKSLYNNTKFYCVPNGCNLPRTIQPKTSSSKIRLGILSMWTEGTLADVRWFIENYLPLIEEKIPNIELYIAGKCENEKIESYFNSVNVNYLGWVDSLDDFFSSIDIYIATVPKGCGILNKVLDAFAHQTYCIGHKNSFSGFYGLENGYRVCSSVDDYIRALKAFREERDYVNMCISNSYKYIMKHNNWENNYNVFVKNIIKDNKHLLYE